MKVVLLGLVLGIAGISAKAQTESMPALNAQYFPISAFAPKMRELACREQAARDMQKPVVLPLGTKRAWEHERVQREIRDGRTTSSATLLQMGHGCHAGCTTAGDLVTGVLGSRKFGHI